MKKIVFRMTALMAAMMMTLTSSAKIQDWGGRVIDEKGEPMPYVNVVLLSLPDSAFVQGAMTDMDGVFKIVTDVNEGLFKVTSVGYQTLYINAGQNLTIQMKEDTQLLKEVVVKGAQGAGHEGTLTPAFRSDPACRCGPESRCPLCSLCEGRRAYHTEKGTGRRPEFPEQHTVHVPVRRFAE